MSPARFAAASLLAFFCALILVPPAPVVALRETRRYEEITRGDRRLEISASYDGLEIPL